MDHKHEQDIVSALEPLVTRMDELAMVFGAAARPVLARVQQRLLEAMAARDRGDSPRALVEIGEAMKELAALAANLDPAEAMLMRSVAEGFQRALRQGSEAEAKERADFMMQRSGAVERKRSDR